MSQRNRFFKPADLTNFNITKYSIVRNFADQVDGAKADKPFSRGTPAFLNVPILTSHFDITKVSV